jgi:hypothetical protein
MRTDIERVFHWALKPTEEMPYKKKTMLKCLEQIEKNARKGLKDLNKKELSPEQELTIARLKQIPSNKKISIG